MNVIHLIHIILSVIAAVFLLFSGIKTLTSSTPRVASVEEERKIAIGITIFAALYALSILGSVLFE